MDRIFIVFGASGEYSDATEWAVRAFATKQEADEWQARCAEAARNRPRRPPYPPNLRTGYGMSAADRAAQERYADAIRRWNDRVAEFVAACPDDRMPGDDLVDYSVAEVPFGADSTALATAPRPLRQGGRHYDLTPETES